MTYHADLAAYDRAEAAADAEALASAAERIEAIEDALAEWHLRRRVNAETAALLHEALADGLIDESDLDPRRAP